MNAGRGRYVWLTVAALVICAVGPFLPSANNRFALDDQLMIEQNPRIADPLDLRVIWLTDWWYAAGTFALSPDRDLLYRPLTFQVFALLHAGFGLDPLPYHAVNLAAHALATLAAAGLTWQLFRKGWLALVTGIVFAVHPVHGEAVISLVGLAELLATLFVCLGLLAFLRADGPRRFAASAIWRVLGALCFLLAVLAKEQGVVFVVLLPLCLWCSRRRRSALERRSIDAAAARDARTAGGSVLAVLLAWLVTAVFVVSVYLPLRYQALNGHLLTPAPPPMMSNVLSTADGLQHAWTLLAFAGEYLRLAFWPSRLSCDYSYDAVPLAGSPADPRVLLALGVLSILLVWSVLSLRRHASRRGLFVTLFFLGTYVLPSNAVVVFRTMVAERLFYLSLLPLTWAVLIPASQVATRVARIGLPGRVGPLIAAGSVLAFVLPCAVRDVARCYDWQDNETLYLTDSETMPRCARLQLKRGVVFIHAGQWERGRDAIQRAVAIAPHYIEAHVELLGYFNRFGPWEDAWREFAFVLPSVGPVPPIVLQQLAARHVHHALPEPVAATAQEALDTANADPANLRAVRDVALFAIRMGRLEAAVPPLVDVLEANPTSLEDRLLLARVLVLLRQTAPAAELYGLAAESSPESAEALAGLAMIVVRGQPEAAVQLAARAAELAPDDDLIQLGAASVFYFAGHAEKFSDILLSLARTLPRDHPTRELVLKLLPPNAPV